MACVRVVIDDPTRPPIDRSAADKDELVPVTATVDLGALRHNARVLQARAGEADLMAIVKADAYGHGAVPVARTLRDEGIRHFAVARPAEAIQLREAGLSDPILVLGAPFPDDLSVYTEHTLDMTVSSPDAAAAACRHGTPEAPLRVHAKVDTGMGRIGMSPADAPSVITQLADAPGVRLAGVWTHFATADDPDSTFADTQLTRFETVLEALDDAPAAIRPDHVHAANTGALLTLNGRTRQFAAPLVRTGISLYGFTATPDLNARIDLRPVMRLRARVTHLKTVPPDTPISYGATWRAPERSRIATLGVGYGDGYPRLCSGRASVRIGDTLRPIVGTICMDMCMVNLGPPDQALAQAVDVGDEATLFGADRPTLYDVAAWADTIPYEVCCDLSPRVPRRYVDSSPSPEATGRPAASAPRPKPGI
jgi:alanine racemase